MDPHSHESDASTCPPFTEAEVGARLKTASTPAQSIEALRDLLCPELPVVLDAAISAKALQRTVAGAAAASNDQGSGCAARPRRPAAVHPAIRGADLGAWGGSPFRPLRSPAFRAPGVR